MVSFEVSQVIGLDELLTASGNTLTDAREAVGSRRAPLVGVGVDIDDCCLNTGFRTAAILEAFLKRQPSGLAEEERVALVQAAWCIALAGEMPYLTSHLLVQLVETHLALRQLPAEAPQAWRNFWWEAFFTNQFLHHELPVAAVYELVQGLAGRGFTLSYVTGRHRQHTQLTGLQDQGMELGTLSSLWQHRFPHGRVFFKPSFGLKDSDWKGTVFYRAVRDSVGETIPVVYLDNSPDLVLLHDRVMTETGLPHLSVWVDTVYDPNHQVSLTPGIRVLRTR